MPTEPATDAAAAVALVSPADLKDLVRKDRLPYEWRLLLEWVNGDPYYIHWGAFDLIHGLEDLAGLVTPKATIEGYRSSRTKLDKNNGVLPHL